MAFYKIEAVIGGISYIFNETDWSAITQNIWRFVAKDDITVEAN